MIIHACLILILFQLVSFYTCSIHLFCFYIKLIINMSILLYFSVLIVINIDFLFFHLSFKFLYGFFLLSYDFKLLNIYLQIFLFSFKVLRSIYIGIPQFKLKISLLLFTTTLLLFCFTFLVILNFLKSFELVFLLL